HIVVEKVAINSQEVIKRNTITSTVPRRRRSRWRSSVKSSVASSKRVAGADKSREGLALRCNERLLEGDALVARQDWFADADEAVAVANRRRHMGNLIATRLPLAGRPTELFEGFEKGRFDVMRLQPAGLGAFHLLAHPG